MVVEAIEVHQHMRRAVDMHWDAGHHGTLFESPSRLELSFHHCPDRWKLPCFVDLLLDGHATLAESIWTTTELVL